MVIDRDKHNKYVAIGFQPVQQVTGGTTQQSNTGNTSSTTSGSASTSTIVINGGGGMTNAQEEKLSGIEAGAQVNQNAYSNITILNGTVEAGTITAQAETDTARISTITPIVCSLVDGVIQLTFDDTNYATKQYVIDSIDDLIGAAPGALDTLEELAQALGDDPNFATTVTNMIANVSNRVDTIEDTYAKLTDITVANITDLNSNWDSLLLNPPTDYVTRWPSWGEVTDKPTWIGDTKPTYTAEEIGALTQAAADDLYVSITGDTMQGPLTFQTSTEAYHKTGLLWNGDTSRLGCSTAGAIGIYAADGIYLRPNWVENGTMYGVILKSDTFTYNGYPILTSENYGQYIDIDAGGITQDFADSRYVNISGDTMTGALTISDTSAPQLKINGSTQSYISFFLNNQSKGYVGYIDTVGTFLQNGGSHLRISNSGLLEFYTGTYNTIWHAGNDGSGSGLDADLLDGEHLSDIRRLGYAMQQTVIDTSSLDENTWYPVTINVSQAYYSLIAVIVSLNNGTRPSWSTHPTQGFSVRKVWYVGGNAWGTIPISRNILDSTYLWADSDPVRGIGQMEHSSNEYVYVRGGGKYFFYTSHGRVVTLRTSTFTVNEESISPTTTAPDAIVRTSAKITDNVASATKLRTACTINGTAFNGTSNIVTSYWGTARTLSLTGNATGSVSMNGSANVSMSVNVNYATSAGNADTLDGVHNGYVTAIRLDGIYTGGGGMQQPSYFARRGKGIFLNMMNQPVAYSDVIYIDAYGGLDVPYVNAIAFQKASGAHGTVYHARAAHNGSSWGTWYPFIDSYNIGSYNAGSATKLRTARTITLSGAVTGSASFDGTANVTIATKYNGSYTPYLISGNNSVLNPTLYNSTMFILQNGTSNSTRTVNLPSLGMMQTYIGSTSSWFAVLLTIVTCNTNYGTWSITKPATASGAAASNYYPKYFYNMSGGNVSQLGLSGPGKRMQILLYYHGSTDYTAQQIS